MKWGVGEIRRYTREPLSFEETVDLMKDLQARNSDIIHAEPVHVSGYLVSHDHEIILHCQAACELTMPSTRTTDAVTFDLEFPIKERYVYPNQDFDNDEYEETTIILEQDFIDLIPAVVDGILLNIPTRIIGEDEDDQSLPSGNDWVVLTESDFLAQRDKVKEETVDPRLTQLKTLFNEAEE